MSVLLLQVRQEGAKIALEHQMTANCHPGFFGTKVDFYTKWFLLDILYSCISSAIYSEVQLAHKWYVSVWSNLNIAEIRKSCQEET